jgi:hypothetical protein
MGLQQGFTTGEMGADRYFAQQQSSGPTSVERDLWHADCFVTGMTDENYFLMLFQIVCLLMFSCGVVVLTHHPEWFGV